MEGSPHNQGREEEPRLKEQHRPWRKSDSRADQRKPKPTASARGRGTARRPKANPTKVGKATPRSWTEEEHRPYQRQVTNMQTRHSTEPRRPDEQQLPNGKPTSTRQITRVTTTAAKLRREDNYGKTSITTSQQPTREARRTNPRQSARKGKRLDHPTARDGRRGRG